MILIVLDVFLIDLFPHVGTGRSLRFGEGNTETSVLVSASCGL